MKTYIVTIIRTERIAFAVEAEDADEARERFWEGDERASETTGLHIENVSEA